jgi:uracil-DNA glycosylase
MPSRSQASDPVPPVRSVAAMARAAASCEACPLFANATQTVFGEGPADARVVLVGEQPGDAEDLAGHPFVGPAGGVLDRALAAAGLDRARVYLTNAVKHFKWEPRGKRRIHMKPRVSEMKACRPWLEAELARLRPRVTVCLGGTAVQAMLGPKITVGASRDKVFETPFGRVIVARHPSSVLRVVDKAARQAAFDELVADLRRARALASGNGEAGSRKTAMTRARRALTTRR